MNQVKLSEVAAAGADVVSAAFDAGATWSGALPTQVLIAPWGEVQSRSGTFVVDEDAVRRTIEAFSAHGTDVPIDYEHQSLGGAFSSPTGQAPAAGWIKRLFAVPPSSAEAIHEVPDATAGADSRPATAGLWAEVQWTPPAAEQLRNGQYRYLSPVALIRRSDRRLVGLHSVALTNKPAIIAIRPIVHREPPRSDVRDGLRSALGCDAALDDDAVMLAATERIAALTMQIDARRAADRVAAALAAGKLVPAQRDWAASLALRDPAAFEEWMAVAPVVVAPQRTRPPALASTASEQSVRRRAEQEYRDAGPLLVSLCSQEAYVADALREAGLAARPS
ncbi:MAG: phage protease [Phycisphaerae bacterium]|nr:phage protease [Phycisphaerae bacterium]